MPRTGIFPDLFKNETRKQMINSVYKTRDAHLAGFTMIELIVVLAIGAMILSIVAVSISDARAKARDAEREEEIKQIRNALNIYATRNNLLPVCATETAITDGVSDCLSSQLVSAGAMPMAPVDPLLRIGACGGEAFVYCYQSNGFGYTLRYRLETDTILGKSAGWQTIQER